MSDLIECKFKITGGAELAKALESKPPIVARRIIQVSLRKAVDPWQKDMIARVRKGWHVFSSYLSAKGLRARGARGQGGRERAFGVISRNIRPRIRIGAGGFSGIAAVGVSRKAFWAKFLEFGFMHIGGKRVGPFQFIRPAFESQKKAVLDAYVAEVREQLRKDLGLR